MERAAPLVLDLAEVAVVALAVAVVGRFPQRVLRALVVVVTLFLARALALALASRQPAMAAPDSATE